MTAFIVYHKGFALSSISSQLSYAEKRHISKEKFVCCLLIIFTIGITFSKIVYLLSEQGLYFGNLRIVYDWTKLYL